MHFFLKANSSGDRRQKKSLRSSVAASSSPPPSSLTQKNSLRILPLPKDWAALSSTVCTGELLRSLPTEVIAYMGEIPSTSFRKRDADFVSLTSDIANIEGASPDNIQRLSSAYDSLLLQFPLCYGYWTRYAYHMARLHDYSKAVLVYERAVNAATYSVDLWTNYCCFAMEFYEDPDDVRRLYERALSFVGKDYLCCILWDKYIEFELANKELIRVAHIYLRTLTFPSKKLHHYYERFKKLISIVEEEMKLQNNGFTEDSFDEMLECNVQKDAKMSEITHILVNQPSALLTPSVFKQYILTGEYLYDKSCTLNKKIACFEAAITRTYFHIQSLDEDQLENWHHYLDFVEKEGDLDWTVKLYERCLIPCADYQEFWIRYAEHLEANGGREIAKNVIERALKVFLKGDAAFHLYSLRFMERIGDIISARSSLSCWEFVSVSDFLQYVTRGANMEKRLGNVEEAYQLYEKAILIAEEKHDFHTLSLLYAHFARFKFMVTGSTYAAREIFLKGLREIPCNKYLMEALIKFFILHGGASQINVLDSVVVNALYTNEDLCSTLSIDDRKDISCLFIEFLDLYGSIHDVDKAWCRHMKLFPHIIRPAAVELNNLQEKLIAPKNKIEEVTCSPPDVHNVDDGFGLSEDDLPIQSGGIETNTDEKGHHASTNNKLGGNLSEDDDKKPKVETIELPTESVGFTVQENMAPDGLNCMSKASKIVSEVKHWVSIDSVKDINPLMFEALAIDSPEVRKRKSDGMSGQDQDSFDKISNSSNFDQAHGFSNMPSETCAQSGSNYVQNNTRLSPDRKQMLEKVESKEDMHSRLNIPYEGTTSHDVNSGADSSVISNNWQTSVASSVTQSLQVSTVQNPSNLQIHELQGHLPQEQGGYAKFQQHTQEQNSSAKIQLQQGYLISPQAQNHPKIGVPSSYACKTQTHQSSLTVHPQSSEAYEYQQHQQEISHQLWYYYQQQMYYMQLQQYNLQMHLEYMKNEQPLQMQQNSPNLQMPDGQEQSNQPLNPQQTMQQWYHQQQVLQNCLYRQYNQMSNHVQMPPHPQSSHQHHQPQVLQEQLQLHQRPFDDPTFAEATIASATTSTAYASINATRSQNKSAMAPEPLDSVRSPSAF